jgi:hypothetical protein
MNKHLRDYLHFYLGCEAEVKRKNDNQPHIGRICEITKDSNHGDWVDVRFENVITVTSMNWERSTSNFHHYFIGYDSIRPILRPLSDMTDEEIKQVAWLLHRFKPEDIRGKDNVGNIKVTNKSPFYYWINVRQHLNADTCIYLLSKGFDLFELIESGLAIDKTVYLSSN